MSIQQIIMTARRLVKAKKLKSKGLRSRKIEQKPRSLRKARNVTKTQAKTFNCKSSLASYFRIDTFAIGFRFSWSALGQWNQTDQWPKLPFKKDESPKRAVLNQKYTHHTNRRRDSRKYASTWVTMRYLRNPRRSTLLRVGQCRDVSVKCEW